MMKKGGIIFCRNPLEAGQKFNRTLRVTKADSRQVAIPLKRGKSSTYKDLKYIVTFESQSP